MSADAARSLVAYRLRQAQETLREAQLLAEAGLFRGASNRAYYAMFHAVQALLVEKGMHSSKHSGVIALFDREFVKAGVLPVEFSKWLHAAFDLRHDADYGDVDLVSPERGREVVEHAVAFVAKVVTVASK